MNKLQLNFTLTAAALMCAILVSCGPPLNLKTPPGFAVYKPARGAFRAISAAGVRIKAYAVKNDPEGDIAMWQTAIDRYFIESGYHLQKREPLSVSGRNGSYSEYRCRYYGLDYIYSLTIVPRGKKLLIVETSGREDSYSRERDRIMQSLRTMEINK